MSITSLLINLWPNQQCCNHIYLWVQFQISTNLADADMPRKWCFELRLAKDVAAFAACDSYMLAAPSQQAMVSTSFINLHEWPICMNVSCFYIMKSQKRELILCFEDFLDNCRITGCTKYFRPQDLVLVWWVHTFWAVLCIHIMSPQSCFDLIGTHGTHQMTQFLKLHGLFLHFHCFMTSPRQ